MNTHAFNGLSPRRRPVAWWRWLLAGLCLAVLLPAMALGAVVSVAAMIVVAPLLALGRSLAPCRAVLALPPPLRDGRR